MTKPEADELLGLLSRLREEVWSAWPMRPIGRADALLDEIELLIREIAHGTTVREHDL